MSMYDNIDLGHATKESVMCTRLFGNTKYMYENPSLPNNMELYGAFVPMKTLVAIFKRKHNVWQSFQT